MIVWVSAFWTWKSLERLLALMADDFLRFHEIHTVVLVGHGPSGLRVSARSEDKDIDAGELVQEAIKDIGDGGGHSHMGGGVISGPDFPDEQSPIRTFCPTI
jgi:nanoRNase/pAp phosphatase (c-di-AMP/oligoRNAs hydrolase)